MAKTEKDLRNEISSLVKQFYEIKFGTQTFSSGESQVRYAGRVFDEKELQAAVEASLDFWLTSGRFFG